MAEHRLYPAGSSSSVDFVGGSAPPSAASAAFPQTLPTGCGVGSSYGGVGGGSDGGVGSGGGDGGSGGCGGGCGGGAAARFAPGASVWQDGPLVSLLEAAAAAGSGSAGAPQRQIVEPVPLPRRFLGCPSHPEEPLQYFCLKCQTHCICAECVLNGDHRGHDVLNVREAARRLPERAAELGTAARLRAEEVAAVAARLREGRRELASLAERGRKDLHTAVEKLSMALQQEEEALLSEVDRCASDLWEMLQTDPETHIGEALQEMTRSREAGDAANALICFSRLRKAVAAPVGNQPDSDRLASQLRGQLQRGFDGRLTGLAGLAECISELRESRISTAAWPTAGAASSASRVASAPPATTGFAAEVDLFYGMHRDLGGTAQ